MMFDRFTAICDRGCQYPHYSRPLKVHTYTITMPRPYEGDCLKIKTEKEGPFVLLVFWYSGIIL